MLAIPHTDSIVTTDPIGPLRVNQRNSRSGYRNVYSCGLNQAGAEVWCAKVKRGKRLVMLPGSRTLDKRIAARHVAAWYYAEYGPQWANVLKARKRPTYLVKRLRSTGKYYVALWVMGRREEVVELVRVKRNRVWRWERKPDALLRCRTKAEAVKEMARYLVRLYGLFGAYPETLLYRTEAPAPDRRSRAA